MMSEKKKRFFESMYDVLDREKGRQLQMYEIIDLLNELYEENQRLRKDKAQLKERLRESNMRLDRFNCR